MLIIKISRNKSRKITSINLIKVKRFTKFNLQIPGPTLSTEIKSIYQKKPIILLCNLMKI